MIKNILPYLDPLLKFVTIHRILCIVVNNKSNLQECTTLNTNYLNLLISTEQSKKNHQSLLMIKNNQIRVTLYYKREK